jgi:hypothetical protein
LVTASVAAFGSLAMQLFQQSRRRAEQHGVTRQHRLMADVLGDHRLAQPVGAHQDQVAGLREEVQRQSTFNDIAFDLAGPGPVEVGHGLKLLDLGEAQPPFQTAVGAFGSLGLSQMFQNLARRPALFGSPRQKVVHFGGHSVQADLLQLRREAIARGRRRANGRAHRKSPDRGDGHPAPEPPDGG